jgi:hypothetical protein
MSEKFARSGHPEFTLPLQKFVPAALVWAGRRIGKDGKWEILKTKHTTDPFIPELHRMHSNDEARRIPGIFFRERVPTYCF